ncbi:MAG: polysaccharide deacetylase family protein, partial [Myxococcota bacterium]
MRSVFGLLLMLLGSAFGLSRAYAQCATPATTTGGIVLTFDDNSVDTWHATRAIFDAYDARATFFVSNFHALDAAQKQKLRDLADDGHEIAAHSYTHGRATDFSASAYMSQQITPQLVDMAAHGFYPRNFAYPYGADAASTTTALMTEFGFIRDTSYFPNHQASYVTCAQSDRFVAGLGIDYQYGLSNANYGTAFDQAMCDNTNLVLYGHHLAAPSNGSHLYYIDHGRLQTLLSAAQSRGLTFRRLRDLCRWEVAFSGQGSWSPAHDSPRRFDEVTFADFDGDGDDDAFRWTGTQWRVLYNQGGTFYEPSGAEHWAHLNA